MKFPKKILLGLQEGHCNLKCGKCYTHGPNPISDNERPKGFMDLEKLRTLLDELATFNPRVTPQTWDEPFLHPELMTCLSEMKTRNLVVTMDTNGLLLTERAMEDLIRLKVDSVFISLDAHHSSTYQKVRGVDRLDSLRTKIHRFLELRGSALFPRIGVSFVSEEVNRLEREAFVSYWRQYVDVIRVNEVFLEGRNLLTKEERDRKLCWSLDDSLMIHPNGEVALCCVDTHYENKIGNVFEEGVLGVWNGTFFSQVRETQSKGDFSFSKTCENCDLWRHDEPVVTDAEDFLISSTTTHTYVNRKDRLNNVAQNRFI